METFEFITQDITFQIDPTNFVKASIVFKNILAQNQKSYNYKGNEPSESINQFLLAAQGKKFEMNPSNITDLISLAEFFQAAVILRVLNKFFQDISPRTILQAVLDSDRNNTIQQSEIDSIIIVIDYLLQDPNIAFLSVQTLYKIFSHPKYVIKNYHDVYKLFYFKLNQSDENPSILFTLLDFSQLNEGDLKQLIESRNLDKTVVHSQLFEISKFLLKKVQGEEKKIITSQNEKDALITQLNFNLAKTKTANERLIADLQRKKEAYEKLKKEVENMKNAPPVQPPPPRPIVNPVVPVQPNRVSDTVRPAQTFPPPVSVKVEKPQLSPVKIERPVLQKIIIEKDPPKA